MTAAPSTIVTPKMHFLSEEHLRTFHKNALAVLSSTGIRVDSEDIRYRLVERGLGTIHENSTNVVTLHPEAVEWALCVSPRTIPLYTRVGDHVCTIGGKNNTSPCFGMGVTALYSRDVNTGDVLPFSRQNMCDYARLANALPLYNVVSTLGIVQDEETNPDLYSTLDLVSNTTKPIVLLVADDSKFEAVLNLLRECNRHISLKEKSFHERPWIIPYVNPVTPLVLNSATTTKMELCISAGLPIIFSSYGMIGCSCPIQPFASIVLLLAELLAGLVIAQMLKEGTPVVLGFLPAFFDFSSLVAFYDSHSTLCDMACSEMLFRFYDGFPHVGSSGSGNGWWSSDILASADHWMTHLTAATQHVGSLRPFIGTTLGDKVFDAIHAVYAHEILSQSRRFAAGFEIPEEGDKKWRDILDTIAAVSPGGSFLSETDTLKKCRAAYYRSPLMKPTVRLSLEQWEKRDRPHIDDFLKKFTVRLLKEAPPPEDREQVLQAGNAFISSFQSSLNVK